MIVGYARVSTPKQLKGHSLDEQTDELKKCGCKKIFKEQYTGTKAHRPKFDKLMKFIRTGDTLYIARLDRIARNMTDMLVIIRKLAKKGVKVVTLKPRMKIDPSTTFGRAMLGMFATFSQLERDLIHDRMEQGKEYELSNGDIKAKGGHPKRLARSTPAQLKRYKRYKNIHDNFIDLKHMKSREPKWYTEHNDPQVAKQVAINHSCSIKTVYNVVNTFKSAYLIKKGKQDLKKQKRSHQN